MSLALYRKYRPSTFAEVIGQEHLTTPLSNALESGQIHHAYLFSGPRGCGKTSSARIMARSLNCEKGPTPNPCGECQSCKDLVANGPGSIDVMELDAATHGLVDDARDLRDKAFFAPVQSRYKIYIIDEAHQLGPGAANALLKVVEEPPPHVLFIFATTEPDKLIATIRSRTHHYPFRLVPPAILASHLEELCQQEKVKVAAGVIPLVVRASGGSVRDALSVLGQLLAGAGKDGVTYEIAVALLGFTDGALLDQSVDAIAARDLSTLFTTVNSVIEAGHDPRRFAQDLLERVRDLILLTAIKENASHILPEYSQDQLERMSEQAKTIGTAALIKAAEVIADGLLDMRGASSPRLTLEVVCARILVPEGAASAAPIIQSAPVTAVAPAAPVEPSAKPAPAPAKVAKVEKVEKLAKPTGDVDIAALRKYWPEVIENVKKQRRLTWSLLAASASVFAIDQTSITITIVNSGAKDSFVRSESDLILAKAFSEVVGVDRKIEVIVDGSINAPTHEQTTEELSDPAELSGQALLAKSLGAQVISKFTNDV